MNSSERDSLVKVLTFNVWGLPDIITKLAYSKLKKLAHNKLRRTARMRAIGERFTLIFPY
jgi:hypothetical protein